MPDREPLPAPFPVGARVQYMGRDRKEWGGGRLPVLRKDPLPHGLIAVVIRIDHGHRGTLEQLLDWRDDPLYHDKGGDDPMRDETRDGCSYLAVDGVILKGRWISSDNANEWMAVQ